MKQHNSKQKQLQEFKNFCEGNADLRELWKKLVKVSFQLRIIQDEIFLAELAADNELVALRLAELKDKRQEYNQILDDLKDTCSKKNIGVPLFSCEEICDLYVVF